MRLSNIVNTKEGPVQGYLKNYARIFKGIPYAKAPVGELRFKAPQPAPVHEEVLSCLEFSSQCPQTRMSEGMYFKEFYSEPGDVQENSEDCLYLNIWTPTSPSKDESGYPVMFWIHGGAFNHGAGSEKEFDGEALCQRGVILVTINYRVGSFGYLSLPELSEEDENGSTGNYGSLDQLFALKWVHENIEAFGGDKRRITIAGQSAGAMSVQALLSSPLSTGLIYRAIMQSGGGIDSGLVQDNPRLAADAYGKEILKELKAETTEDLRKVSAEDLLGADMAMMGKFKGLALRPVKDGYFQTESYHDVLFNGHLQDVPCMLGSTTEDIGAAPKLLRKVTEHSFLETGCLKFAYAREKVSTRPTYVYRFGRQLPGDDNGAFHSSELWYMFGTLDRCWRPMEEKDYQLSDAMLAAWTDFMYGKEPWKPCTKEDPYIQIFE